MKKPAFWKSDWFLGLVVALVLFMASSSDLVQSLERLAYDWGVRASSHSPSARIAVIAIDDQSIANIGRWPWSREIHAQMVVKLKQAGAKVVGYASFFFEPQIDPGLAYVQKLSELYQLLPPPQQQNLAQLDNARRDLQRYQVLYKQESIARQQLDTQAALVRQYEGAIKSDQAAVDSAKLQLIYARITAPLSGRLGLRQVDQGNLVSSSDVNGLVVITQTQPISVVFSLPEIQLPDVREQLHAGQVLQVEAYDRADTKRIALGRLEVLDNQIDVATGTVKLKARFDNADDALFPNQFVNARLRVKTLPDATVIPSAAVQQGSAGAFVFLVQPDNTVLVRQVKLGVVNGAVVAVDEGLQAGDKVVVEGMDRLRAGARVDIVAQPVASTDAAAALSGAAPQMPAADAPAANAAAGAPNAPSPGKAANGAPAGTERSARK